MLFWLPCHNNSKHTSIFGLCQISIINFRNKHTAVETSTKYTPIVQFLYNLFTCWTNVRIVSYHLISFACNIVICSKSNVVNKLNFCDKFIWAYNKKPNDKKW